MKDLETESEGLSLESSSLVDWRVREDLESSIPIDLLGGEISFITVRVRRGRGGSEFGNANNLAGAYYRMFIGHVSDYFHTSCIS